MASSKINFMLRLPRSLRSKIHCDAAEEGIRQYYSENEATFSTVNYVNAILREYCSLPAPTPEKNATDPNETVGLTMQMDLELFSAAKNKASQSNTSLNQMILDAIEKNLEKSAQLTVQTNKKQSIDTTSIKPKNRKPRFF